MSQELGLETPREGRIAKPQQSLAFVSFSPIIQYHIY